VGSREGGGNNGFGRRVGKFCTSEHNLLLNEVRRKKEGARRGNWKGLSYWKANHREAVLKRKVKTLSYGAKDREKKKKYLRSEKNSSPGKGIFTEKVPDKGEKG